MCVLVMMSVVDLVDTSVLHILPFGLEGCQAIGFDCESD
jgi:hypothetical protein